MTVTSPEDLPRRKIGRPRKSSIDNADRVLKVALELFAAQNYSSVSIKDIAKAAGVNASLVHYYFDSKEELFLRVVEDTATEAFNTFETIRDNAVAPVEVLSLWIENHVLQFELMQTLIRISLDYAVTHNRSERIDAAIRRFYDIEAEVLGSALAAGMADGDFVQRSIHDTITFISTFLDGALIRSVMFRDRFDHSHAIRQMRAVVLDYLRPTAH